MLTYSPNSNSIENHSLILYCAYLNYYSVVYADEHSKRHKRNMILKALSASPPDVATLRQLAISRGGLLDDSLRKRAWPCLLDIDIQSIPPKPGEFILHLLFFVVHM